MQPDPTPPQRALDLDAIRARADAATPGPWRLEDHGGGEWAIPEIRRFRGHLTDDLHLGEDKATAEFIAHAREDIPALLVRIEHLEKELAHVVDGAMAQGYELVATRMDLDALRAHLALHLSPECQHTAHDGCDETVVCKGRCWCACHDEDAARAERTEPATGEDVEVVRREVFRVLDSYEDSTADKRGELMYPIADVADHITEAVLAALDLPALRAALGEAREEVQRLTVAIDHCDIERDKERVLLDRQAEGIANLIAERDQARDDLARAASERDELLRTLTELAPPRRDDECHCQRDSV